MICVKREKSLTYEYIYNNVKTDGSCKDGFKHCGGLGHKSGKDNSTYSKDKNIGLHFYRKDRSICIP